MIFCLNNETKKPDINDKHFMHQRIFPYKTIPPLARWNPSDLRNFFVVVVAKTLHRFCNVLEILLFDLFEPWDPWDPLDPLDPWDLWDL